MTSCVAPNLLPSLLNINITDPTAQLLNISISRDQISLVGFSDNRKPMLKEKYNTKSLACRFHYAGLTTSHDLCVQRNMVCKMHWNFLFTNYNEHVNTIWHVEMPILSVAIDTAHCRHLLVVTLSLSVLSCQLYTGVKVCVKSEIYHGDETDIDRVPRCANQYSSVDTFDPYVSVCQKNPHQYEYHVNI